MVAVGLVLVAVGCYLIEPALAFLVTGAILLVLGVLGAVRNGRK